MAIRSSLAGAIAAVLLALALVAGILAWLYYPAIPRTFLGWVLLFVIGIPSWLFLEWLGERIFEARIFSRLGRAGRIALGVLALILFMAVAIVVLHLGQKAIMAS